MQTGDYWRQFESTGSIQDYLQYKGVFDSNNMEPKGSAKEEHNKEQEGTNRDSYAGIHICDGNGTQTDRCW